MNINLLQAKKILTDEEIEALKDSYKMLDTNHDGHLSKQEFQAVLNYNKSFSFNEADMQLFVIKKKFRFIF